MVLLLISNILYQKIGQKSTLLTIFSFQSKIYYGVWAGGGIGIRVGLKNL